jgi:hypothetical protein
MILSNLTPLRSPYLHPRPQVQQQPAKAAPAFVPSVFAPAPAPRLDVEHLTINDVRGLSTASINMLVPHRPDLVARLIVDSGRRRRGELAYPMTSLRPMAHAMLLAGMRRRAEKISDADALFLENYLEEIDAA